LSDTSLAHDAPRHGFVEGLVGGALALVAITVAHASLPDPAPLSRPAPAAALARTAPPAPDPPPALIAFRAPLPDGEVGSPFGLRQLPWEDAPRLHAGVDMTAPDPEPVLAAADGVVTRVGQDPGYGRFVELKHAQGLSTRYGHLERFAQGIAPGVAVKAGTAVGRLGSTGTSTGVHLHFEIRDADDRPMNPELFLGRAFATAADLPLREARRAPRRVRVAYVSRIPKNKRAEMVAKLEAEQASEAGDADADPADPNAQPTGAVTRKHHGRVHVRLRL
jgi:murein DD-endopeptidase MepM/ murein hydrolase activator NlpD